MWCAGGGSGHAPPGWRLRFAVRLPPPGKQSREVGLVEGLGEIVVEAILEISNAILGEGIGGQLLAWAKQVMPNGFDLRTLTDNVASRAFYERHGLIAGGTRINPVNGMETIEYRWAAVAR